MTAGCEVVHPVRTTKTTIINAHKGWGFISASSANGLLFGLHFKSANVTRSIGGCLRNWPWRPALVSRKGATDRGNHINRRAAREQGVGPGIATVIRQGT